MSPNEHIKDEISDVETLLPWYAAGTLSNDDVRRVEAGLDSDPALQRQLELIQEEQEQSVELNEALAMPSANALSNLMAGIAREPKNVPLAINLKTRFSHWVERIVASFSSAGIGISAAAALVVICIQGALLAGLYWQTGPSSPYKTASHGATEQATTGTLALIAFQARAQAGDIAEFLSAHNLQIVAGPRPGGFYTIRIDKDTLNETALSERLEKLRDQTGIVRFLVPSQ